MPSPFPGMDPYLEDPELWSDFHAEMIGAIRALLAPAVQPGYLVYIGERVYVTYEHEASLHRMRPDVAIERGPASREPHEAPGGTGAAVAEPIPAVSAMEDRHREPRVEIRHAGTHKLVTAIEVLSQANKQSAGQGRAEYLRKRGEIQRRDANLVEIDLLRGGERLPVQPVRPLPMHAYLVIVDRATERPNCLVYPMLMQQALPSIGVPLSDANPDVTLDLQEALATAFERGPYALKIDYRREPSPPLSADIQAWADKVLRDAGRR